jgi:hypothetical protein
MVCGYHRRSIEQFRKLPTLSLGRFLLEKSKLQRRNVSSSEKFILYRQKLVTWQRPKRSGVLTRKLEWLGLKRLRRKLLPKYFEDLGSLIFDLETAGLSTSKLRIRECTT